MKYFNRSILILSILLLLYVIVINVVYGNIAFSKILGFACILGILYGIFQIRQHDQLLAVLPIWLKYILYGLFTACLILFIIVESVIIYGAVHIDEVQADKVIVLGAGLKGDQITTSLLYRLDTAIEYYEKFPDTTLIVSGGQGVGETISEASAMYQYLIEHGIPKEKIIQEDQSTSTYENFKFSMQYIHTNDKVMIISNDFHMSRAKLIASRLGIDAYGYSAPSHLPTIINFYIREFFAYLKDFILIRP